MNLSLLKLLTLIKKDDSSPFYYLFFPKNVKVMPKRTYLVYVLFLKGKIIKIKFRSTLYFSSLLFGLRE